MSSRYERYNEITFEAYCKTSICNAILKGRMEKSERASKEAPMSELTNEALYKLYKNAGLSEIPIQDTMTFYVQGKKIVVNDFELGQALSRLTPQKREIVLMSYYWGMNDQQIGQALKIKKSTVQSRRTAATKRLRELLGDR